ncbi:esterase-like activity of phytase family protein [Primorskyibacter sp. S87]|uniref:esterase-like activity of phytase family protein n=1 Tax=Primorskyibacter sp. S87 TaxID=3415126 RepID=UPI003C7DEC59
MSLRLAVAITALLSLVAPLHAGGSARATLLSSFTWQHDTSWFGGFSGLEVSQDGKKIRVLSDRSHIVIASLDRADGLITGATPLSATRIRSSKGKALPGYAGDSEGLAVAPSGEMFISFEGAHRVARFDEPDAWSRVLPVHKAFRHLTKNRSFEALALGPDGTIYTMPEVGYAQNGEIPVYAWNGSAWTQPFTLPAKSGFLPVGADFGPDGRFYVLERAVSFPGFRSRLRRWDMVDGQPVNERLLLLTGPGRHDNLEAVSIWRDTQGGLRATMVSDDNFNFVQVTELVEYALPES